MATVPAKRAREPTAEPQPPNLGFLLLSSQYADATVLTTDGEVLSIHRNIVFPQAPRIQADFGQEKCLKSPWKSAIIKPLLQFLYTGDFNTLWRLIEPSDELPPHKRLKLEDSDEGERQEPGEVSSPPPYPLLADLTCFAELHCAATFYNLSKLEHVALDRLRAALQDNWSAGTFCDLLDVRCNNGQNAHQVLKEIPPLARVAAQVAIDHINDVLVCNRFLVDHLGSIVGVELLSLLCAKVKPVVPNEQGNATELLKKLIASQKTEEILRKEVEILRKDKETLRKEVQCLHKTAENKNKAVKELSETRQVVRDLVSGYNTGNLCRRCVVFNHLQCRLVSGEKGAEALHVFCSGCQLRVV